MRFQDFEKTMSPYRLNRYVMACGGNTKQAMTLYRLNLRVSQEMFTVISCFEVALRNAIDKHYWGTLGRDWLNNAVAAGGIFDNPGCRMTSTALRADLATISMDEH